MRLTDKETSRLSNFLETKKFDGVCGFWIDESSDIPTAYLVLDIDFINSIPTKPGFIAKRIRDGVREEIKKWVGLDVYVGSVARKCSEN